MAARKTSKESVKKTSSRRKSETSIANTIASSPVSNMSTSTLRSFKLSKRTLLGIIAIVAVGWLLYTFKGLLVAATVNGQPITRFELIRELEQQGGKQTLNSLITKTLIQQEAKKQKVTVSDKDIDAEVKQIEGSLSQQGQSLDQALAMQGMTKDVLREQIRIRKIVEKMAAKDVRVTEREVSEYIEKNKDSLPQEGDIESLKKTVTEQLKQQKQSQAIQNWLSNLQSKAKITYFINY